MGVKVSPNRPLPRRYLLCFTACGSTVGLLWLLPGTSLTALNWALLMPHLLVTTGGNVKIGQRRV